MVKKILFIVVLLQCSFAIGQNVETDSLIRKTNIIIEKIYASENWDEVLSYKIENFSIENASLKTYHRSNSILKIVLEAHSSYTKQVNSYFFEGENLIYSYMLEAKSNTLKNKELELKSYFINNQLVYQLDSADAGCLISQDFIKAEGKSILDEVRAIRSLIASNATANN